MAKVAEQHDEKLVISTFVLDMARKRKTGIVCLGVASGKSGEKLIGEIANLSAVRLHDPQIVVGPPVADKGDPFAVG